MTLSQFVGTIVCLAPIAFGFMRPSMKWRELGALVLVGAALIGIEILIDRAGHAMGWLSPRTLREVLFLERSMFMGTALIMGYACMLVAIGNALKKIGLRVLGR